MTDPRSEDMVTMNIIDSSMVSICREMGIVLMKTSYSTIFNEGLDFTCALTDTKGNMIAVAEFCPAQIGGMPLLIKTCAQEIPLHTLDEGDVIIHNDPYRGGLHVPEHTLFKPFYVDGELMGFCVAIGHVAEVGGMVPGGFAGEATEIFHEGFRMPPVKIRKRNKDVPEVWKLWLANVRTPRHNHGDLRAMIGALDTGEKRIAELVKKYGKAVFRKTCDDLMDYAERRMRSEIESFPDGHYDFEDYVENDGIEDKPYRLYVKVHVQGDEMVVDFTGSSPQAKGPINATLGVAWSSTYNAIFHLTDPTIPKNSGAFRPIRVLAAPGSVTNVDYPAPEVAGNTETHPRLAAIVIGALSKCLPERAMASESGTGGNFVFGGQHPDNDEYYACYDLMSGGWGGRSYADGNDAVICINGNCRFIPTEVFETRFPFVVENFALLPDSAGAGKFRGGLGFQKTLRSAAPEITASQCSDRHKIKTWALFGGGEGRNGATLVQQSGRKDWRTVVEAYGKRSSSKFSNIMLRNGDRVRLEVPGGGGYGEPKARERTMIEEDVREGYVTQSEACRLYGYTAGGAD
ncbi:MAG: hydantoinase B/oxoprolinase family protein [Alphaproteobacteria bacterium]|nr:hydantoinase B/oxoprolinase family protein [Alphaproteobacteria bacterium]